MKSRLLFLSLLAGGSVYAEPLPLPPAVDNATYPSAPGGVKAPPSPNALYELMGRMDQLQLEVQQLTGKVEEQTYLITEMKKRQSTMYADFDERIQVLEKKLEGTAGQTGGAPAEQTSGEIKPDAAASSPAPEAGKEPAAPATPAENVPAESKPTPAPVATDEKQPYQHAYDELRNGHTNQAITEFKDLLSKKPNSEYASNAQYWLGEAYRVNQDVESSRKAFTAVVDNYPGSPKVPDALLKLGYIEIEQKNLPKAREYLTKVTVAYPASTAAHLAAKKLLSIEPPKAETLR